jgi:hypothetical protein
MFPVVKGTGQERYKKVEILYQGAIGEIVNLRNKYNFNPLTERLLFNRPTYFSYIFSKNIISHFSYKYLFSQGGTNYQFSVPDFGLLFKVDLIFLVIGIIYLLKLRNRLSGILLFGWLDNPSLTREHHAQKHNHATLMIITIEYDFIG